MDPEANKLTARTLRRSVEYLPSVAVLALLVGIWQVAVVVRRVPAYLLPAPSDIWWATVDERDLLLQNTVPTLERAVGGFLIAACLGLLLAVAIRYSRTLERAVYPIVIASQTVPLLALAPILVILLGFNILPILIVVTLICFFPITVNAVDGFKSVDPDLAELMRTMGAHRWRLFRDVEWPTALPSIFSGLKIAVTFSVVGALFGEYVGSSEGLGWYLQQAKNQFDTPGAFSAMVILTLMGLTLFLLVSLAEKLLLPWYHGRGRGDALLGGRK
jgi:ABC-type nitrate/sulfonate/bicarbonate transport system permease component